MIKRRILAQGDRDGACLLYSIANSAMALRGRVATQGQWTRAVRDSAIKVDDFLSGRGTERFDDSPRLVEVFCNHVLQTLGVDAVACVKAGVSTPNDIQAILSPSSVAIIGVYEGAHWVSAVDIDQDAVFIACSAQALDQRLAQYKEGASPNFGRAFNLVLPFEELRLWDGFSLQVAHT